MWITDVMKKQDMTTLDLRKKSGIPRSTLRYILSGTPDLRNCKAGTICKLSAALNVPMADVLDFKKPEHSPDRNNTAEQSQAGHHLHTVKDHGLYVSRRNHLLAFMEKYGPITFIHKIHDCRVIEMCIIRGEYDFALFLLGLSDYLCDMHQISRFADYDAWRGECMEYPVYPVWNADVTYSDKENRQLLKEAIPQLMRFNIVESKATLKCHT